MRNGGEWDTPQREPKPLLFLVSQSFRLGPLVKTLVKSAPASARNVGSIAASSVGTRSGVTPIHSPLNVTAPPILARPASRHGRDDDPGRRRMIVPPTPIQTACRLNLGGLSWRHSETVLVILVPLTMWKEHQAQPKYPQKRWATLGITHSQRCDFGRSWRLFSDRLRNRHR